MVLKKIIFLIPIFFLLTTFVCAEDDVFKLNEPANLKITCYDGDKNYCDASTTCTLTIIYPDGTTLLDGGIMQYNPNYFNYSIEKNVLNQLGYYEYSVGCQDPDYGSVSVGKFLVTTTGGGISNNKIVVYFGLLIVLFIFGLIFGKLGFEFKTLQGKLLSFGMSYIFFTLMFFSCWNIGLDLVGENNFIPNIFRIIFYFLIISGLPLTFGAIAYYIYVQTKSKEIEKLLNKGFSLDEAERRVFR